MIAIDHLQDFDTPGAATGPWEQLLKEGATDVVFLTRPWLRAWWESFGRGKLLLLLALQHGRPVALAPLFADGGMVFFVGSGGSDYLDFIGDIHDENVLCNLLDAARGLTPNFLGCRFYHVPDRSTTGGRLQAAAERIGWQCFDEGSLPAPALDLVLGPDRVLPAAEKTSLRRHERAFRQSGQLQVIHLQGADAIAPHLDDFFAQHVSRWAGTPFPSLFTDPVQRDFYRRLTQTAAGSGWLRFTRLDWNGRAVAFHFGSHYRGRYLWYKPSFDIELSRRSPGEVLLRQLLLAAVAEEACIFDFGLGDEPFKHRFASRVDHVRTWGLYPPEVARSAGP